MNWAYNKQAKPKIAKKVSNFEEHSYIQFDEIYFNSNLLKKNYKILNFIRNFSISQNSFRNWIIAKSVNFEIKILKFWFRNQFFEIFFRIFEIKISNCKKINSKYRIGRNTQL
jgi:hypothetical protein